MNDTTTETFTEYLKECIENIIGYKVRTPRDFDALATSIFENTKQMISPTTIKRFWGYLVEKEEQRPRINTLNIFAQYVGYPDFETFCKLHCTNAECESAFLHNNSLQEVVIPDSVTFIGAEAFTNSKSLQAVTIGNGVRELAAYAFKDCSNLQKVVSRIPADRLTATGSGCFENIGKECVLYVPRGAKSTYENTLGWNNFAKIVEMDM